MASAKSWSINSKTRSGPNANQGYSTPDINITRTLRTGVRWCRRSRARACGPGEHAGHGTSAPPSASPAIDPALFDTFQRIVCADIITALMTDIKPRQSQARPGT
jgi:hypothetical protein